MNIDVRPVEDTLAFDNGFVAIGEALPFAYAGVEAWGRMPISRRYAACCMRDG